MRNTPTAAVTEYRPGERYTLPTDTLAIGLASTTDGHPRLEPMSKIPEGAQIECCGEGLNERMLKVRWRGKFYFVFSQDLKAQGEWTAQPACCQD